MHIYLTRLQLFTGKVYPDRSFSVGRTPTPKKLSKDTEYDKNYEDQFDSYVDVEVRGKKRIIRSDKWFSGIDSYDRFIKSPELSQNPKRYGSKGITRFGRRIVKNSAILLERKYGIKRLGFVTCTLPNYSRRVLHCLSSRWGEITRRFFQKLKRLQEKLKVPTDMIATTEIQEKRYRKTGCIVPHIHFIYVCKTRSHERKFVVLASIFRRYWQESVEQVIQMFDGGVTEKLSFKASVDCQVIKKSAAAYLGKYMSKGGEIIAEIEEEGLSCFLPKQWWSASSVTKKMYKESIITLDTHTCSFLMYNLGDCLADGWLTWCNYVDVEINGEIRIMGCVGVFSEEHYYLLQD